MNMGRSALAILAAAMLINACGGDDPPVDDADAGRPPDGGVSPAEGLYDRLGQEEGIADLIGYFLLTVTNDTRINGYFLNSSVDQQRLSRCLVKFLGAATGGPQIYPGPNDGPDADGCRNMADSHRGLGISTQDFADLGEDLVMVLREEVILSELDVSIIQGALAPLAETIVENPNDNETIYLRARRRPGIQSVIDDFVRRVVANVKINGYFLNDDISVSRLSTCLTRQLCQATGGPCKYGEEIGDDLFDTPCKSMRESHLGLGISLEDFNDLAGDLIGALDDTGVPQSDIDAIIAAIGPLAGDIIEDRNNDATIYQRMGRKPEIQQVIEDFIGRVIADPKINGYFLNQGLNAGRLGTCLIRQVCQATGGPCKYGQETGPERYDGLPCRDMLSSHAGLNISSQDFADLAGHLVDSLVANTTLAQADISGIVAAIGPLADQIVTAPNNNETIYHRMGRKPGVQTVIDDFVARVVADPKINGYFLNAQLNVPRLHSCLVRQICGATGGPCRYGFEAGPELFDDIPCRDMLSTHQGLGISTGDFNDLASALVGALTSSSPLSQADIMTIVEVIAPLSPMIVEDEFNEETIYQRVGRKPGIQIIIADFVTRVVGDASLVGFFAQTNADRLGTCLVRQLCQATGGPCRYGFEVGPELFDNVPCRDMTTTHTNSTNPPGGMGAVITKADFDTLVGHLVDAMVAAGSVSPEDRDGITGALAPLCPQIVAGGTGC